MPNGPLALTQAVTRLCNRTDTVPDATRGEAARHYDERALAALVITLIGTSPAVLSP